MDYYVYSLGTINPVQLYDEIISQVPSWRGQQLSNGSYVKSLISIEIHGDKLIVGLPSGGDKTIVDTVISNHTPDINYDSNEISSKKSARQKLKDVVGLTDEEINQILPIGG